MKKQSLQEDLGAPLDKVHRGYIRRPATIILTPIIIAASIVWGIIDTTGQTFSTCKKFYKECWPSPLKKNE